MLKKLDSMPTARPLDPEIEERAPGNPSQPSVSLQTFLRYGILLFNYIRRGTGAALAHGLA